ncbi:MAG TPA: VOC family protein [Micromonosporaceae bacterium]|nr:VOC family protein [Micromonosporaceae bacterium]
MTDFLISGMYPRLVVSDGARAIDFYAAAFGAVETERHTDPEGKIVHAGLTIGGFAVAVKDEGGGDPAPPTLGGTPVILALDVADPDGVADAMLRLGATVVHAISDQPYGRGGRLADPFGHHWMLTRPPSTL